MAEQGAPSQYWRCRFTAMGVTLAIPVRSATPQLSIRYMGFGVAGDVADEFCIAQRFTGVFRSRCGHVADQSETRINLILMGNC